MRRLFPFLALPGIVGAGLLLRFLLADVVLPGQGFATDLQLFAGWARSLAAGGPATFLAAPLGFAGRAFRGPRAGAFGPGPGAVGSLHLPLADLARGPLVATTVAVGQTATMLALVVARVLVVNRKWEPPAAPATAPAVPTASRRPPARTEAGRAGG